MSFATLLHLRLTCGLYYFNKYDIVTALVNLLCRALLVFLRFIFVSVRSLASPSINNQKAFHSSSNCCSCSYIRVACSLALFSFSCRT
jgi:hypothetical protein